MERENKKKKQKKTSKLKQNAWIIGLVLILILQVGVRIYAGTKKNYIHIDEGYSYGLMNYNKVEIMQNEDFYDHWHEGSYYKDYLTISKEEAKDLTPVYENQKNDVHPPLFYLLLRIAASFTIGEFSIWTGITLNIFIFILSSLLVYAITYQLTKNRKMSLLTTLISGLTMASIDTTMFIRMYALNALNLLILAYWHVKHYEDEKLTWKELLPLGIAAVIGSLTHYYYLIFLGIIYILYMIRYISKKNWKNVISYTITMILAAVVSLLIFPYSFAHMFMGYRGQGAMDNLKHIETMWRSLGGYLGILNNSAFNGVLVFLIIGILGIVAYKLIKNRKITIQIQNKKIWYIAIPTIIYFLLVALVSPYIEVRYIIPVCPLFIILVIYLVKVVLEKIANTKIAMRILVGIFVVMLILPHVLHLPIKYLYTEWGAVVNRVSTQDNLPTIYLLNMNDNRFMDDLYLFSMINKSYQVDVEKCSVEHLKQIFSQVDTKDGVLVFIGANIDNDKYIERVKQATNLKNSEFVEKMNACFIYKVY